MGIFTRFRDIVGSNINTMLDRAEDPEKLIKLMIQEMEDTLIELKAACAGVMASNRRIERQAKALANHVDYWEDKAGLAVNKGRDDLARSASASICSIRLSISSNLKIASELSIRRISSWARFFLTA